MNSPATEAVLAVLDDACAASAVLDISTALAQLLQRQLQLVYVESAAALAAAELSATRVWGQAATQWSPFAPPDVERAWRAHASRLQALAAHASAPRAVRWSLRVTRGALPQTALALLTESDLLLVGCSPATFALERGARRRHTVAALDDGGPAGEDAVRIASRLAAALGWRLQTERADPAHGVPTLPKNADLLVLPTTLAPGESQIAGSRSPLLLVRRAQGTARAPG